jgi:hypothetical protein
MMALTASIVSSSFLESIGPKARPDFLSFFFNLCDLGAQTCFGIAKNI